VADRDGSAPLGDIVRLAKHLLAELTGLRPGTVTGVVRDDDGAWRVTVEVLELERIPHTMDVLGAYEVTVSGDGDLRGYRRVRRYHRSSTEED
jgi:hypothetical protein